MGTGLSRQARQHDHRRLDETTFANIKARLQSQFHVDVGPRGDPCYSNKALLVLDDCVPTQSSGSVIGADFDWWPVCHRSC
jgi:hypothetical protein